MGFSALFHWFPRETRVLKKAPSLSVSLPRIINTGQF